MLSKLLVGVGFALCVAACASNPSAPAAATSKVVANAEPGCASSTGTRIALGPHECAAAGYTWTQGDMKVTGATDAAGALRLLDPTVIIRGD